MITAPVQNKRALSFDDRDELDDVEDRPAVSGHDKRRRRNALPATFVGIARRSGATEVLAYGIFTINAVSRDVSGPSDEGDPPRFD